MRSGSALWTLGVYSAAVVLVGFLVLPVSALLFTLRPSDFVAGITHPSVGPAMRLSVLTTLVSLTLMVGLGTPLAWLVSQRQDRWTSGVETFLRLPAVLPPAVAGVALLLAFGRRGLLGGAFSALGWSIPFTTVAVVMAEVFVAAPFYLQAAIAAFRRVDREQLIVARSLGAGPARVFFRVAVPAAAGGLVSGAGMAWARALGEFGATLMFAGNLQGTTQTLTLAVYSTFESDMRAARAMSAVLVVLAFALLLVFARNTPESR
ncbi:MAG: ABC transporter permease [Myxococcota bacterium]